MRYSVALAITALFLDLSSGYTFANAPASEERAPVLEYDPEESSFDPDPEIWDRREDLRKGIENNLSYLGTPHAGQAYRPFAEEGISQARVRQSLRRFDSLLRDADSSTELIDSLRREFVLYRSKGRDGQGTVRFTGYFQPTYPASRLKSEKFPFPIYRQPQNFPEWNRPHPARTTLEGWDGKGNPEGPLKGLELAWLPSRYEVFMIQIQGSAILDLDDGSRMAVGYSAGTDYKFRGVTKAFLSQNRVSWTNLRKFFKKNPDKLNEVMSRNNRFIFFKENTSFLPIGSLGFPVIPERSIATDKVMLPPGALGLIRASFPQTNGKGRLTLSKASRIVLDQDTGSAIKGPGRVDIFMGTGTEAQRKANSVFSDGELFYLLLRRWDENQAL